MHEVKERQKIISQKQAKEEAKKIIQDGDKVGCEIQVW